MNICTCTASQKRNRRPSRRCAAHMGFVPAPPKTPRISPAMFAMLKSVHEHGEAGKHLRGNSQHGGAGQTIDALRRYGLVSFRKKSTGRDELTEEGRKALGV